MQAACLIVSVIFSLGVVIAPAAGQDYPTKPVRIITGEPGGDSDFGARVVAQGIAGPLGQAVIVDNRPSSLSALIASKAPPDGYTLLVIGGGIYLAELLQPMGYETMRDFAPVTQVSRQPNMLVLHPALTVSSVKELVSYAKNRPGTLNYSAGATGGSPHLSAELFKMLAGIDIVRVPYKGGGPALNALLGGEVQLMFPTASAALPHVKSGKLRALGVTSAESSPLVPGVPAVAASLPGYESVSMTAIFAPARTPAAVITRLNQEIARFLKTPQAKERFFNAGSEIVGSLPRDLAATVKSEIAKWGKLIKDARITAD